MPHGYTFQNDHMHLESLDLQIQITTSEFLRVSYQAQMPVIEWEADTEEV